MLRAGEARHVTVAPERVAAGAGTHTALDARLVFLLPVAFGLLSAWFMPRGPVTTAHALWSLGLSMLVGLALGYLSGQRHALLLGPLAYLLAFELARLPVRGPTVDLPTGGVYGFIALATGRLFPALLTLVPLVAGATLGLALAARTGRAAPGAVGAPGAIVAAAVTVGLAALAVVVARPASTAAIVGPDGGDVPGSVAELSRVVIGGHEQVLLIRGRDTTNPVLLYLAGGPGGTDLGAMRRDTSLEQDFVVVTWEQRGAGKSYAALDPLDTFTVEQFVADATELAQHLRARFGVEKVYLVGQSWGSTLGALVVQRRPDLFHAFVGVGQMVSQSATDRASWEDAVAWADANGHERLAAQLRRNGAPPYENVLAYAPLVASEHDWNAYPGFDGSNEMPGILLVPEYTFMDRMNAFRGFLDSAAALYPQLRDVDFRRDVTRLEVPYVMVMGEHETRGRTEPAAEWFAGLAAPSKRAVVFEGAGHRANFDQPGRFAALMREVRELFH